LAGRRNGLLGGVLMVVNAYFDTGQFDNSYFDNVYGTDFANKNRFSSDMGAILTDDVADTFNIA
jgi:hypothetical protein